MYDDDDDDWECLTSEDIVLVVLISLRANLNETLQAIVVDKLMHQVLVILEDTATYNTDKNIESSMHFA